MNTQHGIIQPSALHLIKQCAGSLTMGWNVEPLPETEEQREGHAAHWVALQFSNGVSVVSGDPTPFGINITDDMIDGAMLWLEAIGEQQVMRLKEQKLQMPRIHEWCEGTPDYADFEPAKRLLRIADYKFGHRAVDPFENWQLLAYYVGARDLWQLIDLQIDVEFIICQPRYYGPSGPIRRWRIAAVELRGVVNQLTTRVGQALGSQPVTTTGTECADCPARHLCPTFQQTTAYIADFTGRSDPMLTTPTQVGAELLMLEEAAQRIKGRVGALQAQAEAFIRNGKRVPNYELQPKASKYDWNAPIEQVLLLGEMLELDLKKPPALITPTQAAQAATRAGVDPSLISALADRQSAGMKLSRFDSSLLKKVFTYGN